MISALYKWQYRARQWLVGRRYQLFHSHREQTSTAADELVGKASKVLLIVTGLIGDTVMSTPVIIWARRLWPDAEITILGRRHNLELLADCPLVDAFHEARAIPFTLIQWRAIAALKRWLSERNFNIAIILLGDQFAQLLAEARVPVRVGVKGHLLEACLTHTYDIGSPRTWGPPERLNALRCLGYELESIPPQLWVSTPSQDAAREKLAGLGLASNEPYAVVHPFGSTLRQWWPPERVGILAQELRQQLGLRTVLIGGLEARDAIPQETGLAVVNTVGLLSLPELMSTIKNSTLVISTDSGPFHIAGALGRPLIGLFRAQRPEHAGRYPQAKIILGQDASCQHRCQWDYCQTQPCRQLHAVSVEEVLSVAASFCAGAMAGSL